MNALERWQTAITSNLAAGSVTGFKKNETTFSSALAANSGLQTGDSGSAVDQMMPQATSQVNDSQGPLRQTGSVLNFAVQGPGYFQVQTPGGGKAYTRDGEFHLDATGTLVTNQGLAVLGDSGPIKLDMSLGPVTVDPSGEISQGDTVVGKLAVADLSNSGQLQRSGNGLMAPANGSVPQPVENPVLMQGYVEDSNVVPLQEMVNLISVSRAYEVSQKLITSMDQTSHAAVETLGTP